MKDRLIYSNIEHFVKEIKTHRDVSRIDTSYIDEVWKKSIGVKIEDESTWTTEDKSNQSDRYNPMMNTNPIDTPDKPTTQWTVHQPDRYNPQPNEHQPDRYTR